MKVLLPVLILFVGIKTYSISYLKEKTEENILTASFIDYDLNSSRLDNIIKGQVDHILDISKTKKEWYLAAKDLTNKVRNLKYKIKIKESTDSTELVEIFNSAKFRDLLDYQNVRFKENPGLSFEHNCLLLIADGYNEVLNGFSKDLNAYKERPFLISLERRNDSIDLLLVSAIQDKFDAQLVYKGDTMKVDSLPINIGQIDDNVLFLVTNPNTNHTAWYGKRY